MDLKDYITIVVAMVGCGAGLVSLLITISRYRYERLSINITYLDISYKVEYIYGNRVKVEANIIATIQNESLTNPIKLNFADIEYRKLIETDYKKEWWVNRKYIDNQIIEKGQDKDIEFFYDSENSEISIDKEKDKFYLEVPESLFLNRVKFYYTHGKTKWVFIETFSEGDITLNGTLSKLLKGEDEDYMAVASFRFKHIRTKFPRLFIFFQKRKQEAAYRSKLKALK